MTAVAREWWDSDAPSRAPRKQRKRKSIAARFWALVDKTAGPNACWPFRGATQSAGYGNFRVNGTIELAHRVAFVLTHGPIEPGLYILHSQKCETKRCCNGRHLRQGTQLDNMADFMKLVYQRQRKPSKALGPLA